MRGLAILLAVALDLASAPLARAGGGAGAPIIYAVSPRFEGQALTGLQVQISLTADPSGRTALRLPEQRMGHDHLWKNLQSLTVAGATAIGDDDKGVRLVRSAPGGKLIVRYVVTSAIDHEPKESDHLPAEPWVRPDWFFVDTASALLTIDGSKPPPARFAWKGWPSDFQIDSSFAGRSGLTTDDMAKGLLIGGRTLRITHAGEVRLAMHGQLDAATDTVLAQDLRTILRAERAFFGETAPRPYLVAAATVRRESAEAFMGTGKQEAFGMTLTPSEPMDSLRPSLAHELFHDWNPAKLGGHSSRPSQYWFSEGFTDFYMLRILAREGLITPEAFVDQWNAILRAYGTSPAQRLSGEEAGKAFWTDPFAEKLPYQRGALLAALWDERLRAKGSSLDDVVRRQAQAAARRKMDTTAIDVFVEQAAQQGLDPRPDIDAFARRGDPIVLTPTAFAPCADVVVVTAPVFDLGFTPDVGQDGLRRATKVRSDTPAARAGLREGEVILEKLSGTNGDSLRAYDLRVRGADGAERRISFMPQGETQVAYQQLHLRADAAAKPALCVFR